MADCSGYWLPKFNQVSECLDPLVDSHGYFTLT